jgi:ABC-type sugar transport system permease subunit
MGFAGNRRKIYFLPYVLILPAFLLILLFKAYPIFTTIVEGFRDRSGWTLSVYQRVFTDLTFWNSLRITIKFNLVMVPFQIVMVFIMALVVNIVIKGIGIFRTVY